MAIYNYQAKDEKGALKEGTVEAISPGQASEVLHGHGLMVISLEEAGAGFELESYIPFLNRVSRKELVLFSRQLSTLMNAKVPIVQSLDILRAQVTSHVLKNVIVEIKADVEGGKSFSEAVSRFPKVFSDLYVNLVKAGEISGTIDEALNYLADQQEKDYDLMSKVRGAMTYPIFIISAIIVVGGLMFLFVLPQMIAVLQEAGAELPLTTRILIFMTNLFQHYWLVLFLVVVGGIVGFQLYKKTIGGKIVWDTLKLKIPIVGRLLQKIYMDRFARNLSTLIGGGIPIVQALHSVADIVGNSVYKRIIRQAADDVETGKSIAAVFAQSAQVPAIVTQMIKVGEQTGRLDEILSKLAKFYDKEVENTLGTLTTLLEPFIMIVLGLAVAVMVAGILLPIYNLSSIQ